MAKPKQPEHFTPTQIETAIRQFLDFGEQTNGKVHQGYYAGLGWPARCLRWYLERIAEMKQTRKAKK